MADEGKKCPKCGAAGEVYQGEHETVAHQTHINGLLVVDIGWKCGKCGYEFGFEFSGDEK